MSHRFLAPHPACDDRRDRPRQPWRTTDLGDAPGAATTTIRSTAGARGKGLSVQASNGRPPIADRSLSSPAIRCDDPAAGTTMSHAQVAGGGPLRHSTRGWAKIIGPATVRA